MNNFGVDSHYLYSMGTFMKKNKSIQKGGELPASEDELLIMAAELGADVPELDLHERRSRDDARQAVIQWIHQEAFKGTPVVRIIHGKGEGKLRTIVCEVLEEEQSIVLAVRQSSRPDEQGGALYAVLTDCRSCVHL